MDWSKLGRAPPLRLVAYPGEWCLTVAPWWRRVAWKWPRSEAASRNYALGASKTHWESVTEEPLKSESLRSLGLVETC